jgi:hypothetical protein
MGFVKIDISNRFFSRNLAVELDHDTWNERENGHEKTNI